MARVTPQRRRGAAVLAAAVLVLGACTTGTSDDEPTPAGTTTTSAETSAPGTDEPTDDPEEPVGEAVVAPPRETLDEFYDQQLTWGACAGGSDGSEVECATLVVPLDYLDPDGATLDIAVNRISTTGGSTRVGSLIVNPGGPGGSGLDYASQPDVVSQFIREGFDVVGFDPRGVGASSPLRCLDDAALDEFLAIDQSPDDAAELDALDDTAAAFAAACEAEHGDLLAFLGTVDVARDLDVLREVLGDEQLHYLGKSYGTFIGALYAEQYPQNVGRLVLDGAVDPAEPTLDQSLAQAAGFEQALVAFAEDCLNYTEEGGCPFAGESVEAGVEIVADLLAEADSDPLPSSTGRPLTQSLAVLGVAVTLYDSEFGWPLLRQALTDALDGNGDTLLLLSDIYTDRSEDGTYTSNGNEVIYAVNCLDDGPPGTRADAESNADEFTDESPRFGPFLAYGGLPCTHWPAPPTFTPHPIAAEGAAPILVVGTTRDPATPYEAAERLAEQLSSGVLLTYRGDGHTAYQRGNICIDEAVDAYLLDGVVPDEGTRC